VVGNADALDEEEPTIDSINDIDARDGGDESALSLALLDTGSSLDIFCVGFLKMRRRITTIRADPMAQRV
jgi:hypothetical protein